MDVSVVLLIVLIFSKNVSTIDDLDFRGSIPAPSLITVIERIMIIL